MKLLLKGLFHMLNNKGQSLALFVMFLPIMLLILILIVDLGRAVLLYNELKNINNIVLEYGLDHMDDIDLEDGLVEIINLNKSDIDIVDVNINDERIYVDLSEDASLVFAGFIDIPIFNISTSYVGYIENGEKRIEKLGD